MPSLIARLLLFLSGYFPLFAIFSVQLYPKYGGKAVWPSVAGAVAVLGLITFLRWVNTSEPRPLKITAVQRKDSEVISYTFTYIFPFLAFKPDDIANNIGLGIFFLVLLVLNVSSNLVHINPMLNLGGYHLLLWGEPDGVTEAVADPG